MSQERLKLAIGRLEYALSRAESSSNAIIHALNSHSRSETVNMDENYQILKKKHDLLKKQAADALSAIESLIPQKGQN